MKKLIISVLLVIVTGLKAQLKDTTICNSLIAKIDAEPNDNVWEKYNDELLVIAEKNHFNKYLSIGYDNKGVLLANKGAVIQSLDYLNKALKIRRIIGSNKELAYSLSNIGEIYYRQYDLSKSLEYITESYEKFKKTTDSLGLSLSLMNLSKIYADRNETDAALLYVRKAVEIQEKIGYKADIYSQSLNIIGNLLEKKGDKGGAIEYYLKSLEASEKLGNKTGVSQSYVYLSNSYLNDNSNKAMEYGTLALEASKGSKNPITTKMVAKTLFDVYQKQNKPAQALEMYQLYIKMRDSINNDKTSKAVIQKQYQIEYEKKALADSLRSDEERKITTLKIEKQEIEKAGLFGGLGLVIIFACVIFNRFKLTQRQKAVIENHQKEILASIRYAKRIQTSLITSEAYIEKSLSRLQIL